MYVRASMFGFANWIFPEDSVVREVLDRFVQKQVGFHTEQDQNQEKLEPKDHIYQSGESPVSISFELER